MLKIARSYGVLPEVIAEANGLGRGYCAGKRPEIAYPPVFLALLVRVLFLTRSQKSNERYAKSQDRYALAEADCQHGRPVGNPKKSIEVEADNKCVEQYGAQAGDNFIIAKTVGNKGCQQCGQAAKDYISGAKGTKGVGEETAQKKAGYRFRV